LAYSHSQLASVYKYIMNQEEPHRKKTFREEYTNLLNKFQVVYEERYLFEGIDEAKMMND